MANKAKVLTGAEFQEVRLNNLEEKAQFTGEESAKGKAVNHSLRERHITEGEEHALIRKALMHIIAKHGDENDPELAEFIAYYNAVEEIKVEVESNEHPGE